VKEFSLSVFFNICNVVVFSTDFQQQLLNDLHMGWLCCLGRFGELLQIWMGQFAAQHAACSGGWVWLVLLSEGIW
jgi:hypothetical protein